MNRKFFNLLLMGALAVTAIGSVSSCKDYDDDINNLQEQINKVALQTTVDELKTQLDNVQLTANAAKATAETALTKASGALTEGNLTSLNEAVAALQTTAGENAAKVAEAIQAAADAQTSADEAKAAADAAKTYADEQIAAKLAEVESTVDAVKNNADVKAAIQSIAKAEVDATLSGDLKKQLDNLETLIKDTSVKDNLDALSKVVDAYKAGINALYSAVTGVEVIGMWTESGIYDQANVLGFIYGKQAADYTFGEAEKENPEDEYTYKANTTVTFVKDKAFSYSANELLIRVNPTNVDLTTATIKFLDSKGNDLDGVIEVTNVEKFDGLITRGTNNATGLWKISVKCDENADIEDVTAATMSGESSILYAIGVNNTTEATDRYVVSNYDVAFKYGEYKAPDADALDAVVVGTDEDNWATLDAVAPQYESTPGDKDAFAVNNGQDFYVSFADLADDNADVKDFQYFYVVRDDNHAEDDDEIRAWESYEYTGDFGKMIAVNHGAGKAALKVTIPSKYKAGDEVQFRVFAIDYTGAVVANKAFRVFVGADKVNQNITGDLKAVGHEVMATNRFAINMELDGGITSLPVAVTVKNAGGEDVELTVSFYKTADATTATTTVSEAKYVQFSCTSSDVLQKLADGAKATGTLEFTDSHELVVNTINVELKKVMPTAADVNAIYKKAGMTWKAKQLVNGVYTAYLMPAYWGESSVGNERPLTTDEKRWQKIAAYGLCDLAQALTGIPGDNTSLSIAKAELEEDETDGEEYYTGSMEVTNANDKWMMYVNTKPDADGTKLVDNKTKHAAAFGFNYGDISSDTENHAEGYTVSADDPLYKFNIVFANPLDESVQTYAFAKKNTGTAQKPVYVDVNVLKYGVATPVNLEGEENIASYLKGTNSYNPDEFSGLFYVSGDKGLRQAKYLADNTSVGEATTLSASAKLISNETGKEDYFKVVIGDDGQITFENQSQATPPSADVESTLIITLYDSFLQKHEYKIPFKVLKPTNE